MESLRSRATGARSRGAVAPLPVRRRCRQARGGRAVPGVSEPARCGRPDCPVPLRPPSRGLRSVVWEASTRLRRGYKRSYVDPAELVPGRGDTRFAPLNDTAPAYVAATTLATLLESAFHNAAPPNPQIPQAVVQLWAEAEVELTRSIRLIDLRDREVERLGVARSALVATSAAHYPCTRDLGSQLQGRSIGGQNTHGLV